MNASQMISIFSRITGIYTLWNSITLMEKINLWFGYDEKSFFKFTIKLQYGIKQAGIEELFKKYQI